MRERGIERGREREEVRETDIDRVRGGERERLIKRPLRRKRMQVKAK